MPKFGLGKGLAALIPTDQEPEDFKEENVVSSYIQEVPEKDNDFENGTRPRNMNVETFADPVLPVAEPPLDVPRDEITSLLVDEILPNPFQPRKMFDPDSLRELAESIKAHGIIQQLVVTRRHDGKFELIAGERRLQAAKLIRLVEVPAIIRKTEINNQQRLELAIIENLQRDDLNIIEEAQAFSRLHDEFGLTYDEIATKVSKSRPAVSNIVRLLQLPMEIQAALMNGKISEGHGRALLQVADREGQFALYEMIIKKKLATDQAMALSREWTKRPQLLKMNTVKDREIHALQNHLRGKLNVKSVLVSRNDNGGGKIWITCLTDDEFQALIDRFDSLG